MIRSIAAVSLMLSWMMWVPPAGAQADLASGFQNPPASARPHTWWHWMNGNITKEGITADLAAMKEVGLGGAQMFNVSESIPVGPVLYMSEPWRELVKFAAEEAQKQGLELCMHNCAGWSSSGGPWITPEHAMQQVVVSETHATGPTAFAAVLPQPKGKLDFYRDIAVLAFPTPADDKTRIKDIKPKAGYEARYGQQPQVEALPPACVIKREAIVDLTAKLAKDGTLKWDVPKGDWTILRIGYTPTGAVNAPSPDSGRGLECDKLSRAGLDAHWAGGIAPVLKELGPLAGKVLVNCLIDSYEVGHQNWTERFREEFQARRGYDLLPYLPVLTGRVVDSAEVSERFLWDFRRTIGDLFADNYYSYFAELCHKNGLRASIEPYDGPFECLLSGRDADIPMGEFWVGGGESESCKLAASVAHTYGRTIVGAESFTASPSHGAWQNYPYRLKAVGDLMYSTGINRYIIHRYAHQPWLDKFPGMTMGQWGTHFERTTTWWKQGAAWVQYLARCQYLLQQGRFAADVCYFAGEEAPNGAPHHPELKAAGYDYDACNADVLLNRMLVENGRLALPGGLSYRVLVLPDTPFMTPKLAAKIGEFVKQGAVVIGPKPSASPSLAEYPQCDAKLREIADAVWGDCDGKAVKEHAYGQGKVMWGLTIEEALARLDAKPDCEFAGSGPKPRIAWIHRAADGADWYFVANQRGYAEDVDCTFRVSGKAPELWYPDTGKMEPAPSWNERAGRIAVPIHFDPAGSVFVVFRRAPVSPDHFASVKSAEAETAAPAAPHIEIQKAVYEAVDGAGGADVTAKVAALVASGEWSIPANNGVFGDPTYNHVKRLRVDYKLNGEALSKTAPENGTVVLAEYKGPTGLPDFKVTRNGKGELEILAFQPATFEGKTSAGQTVIVKAESVSKPVEIAGPWVVRFPSNWGAPPSATLDKLISWTEHSDPGVRYFSGTAEYEHEFELTPEQLDAKHALFLDLGRVECLAQVTLNGHDLGVWWKPPFAADITEFAKAGKNVLKVSVTNLWINRLIGDEQFPDDCEWKGKPLKSWPEWFVAGKPRPVPQRLTFTTWKHYAKDSPLHESGLLGPVMLRWATRSSLDAKLAGGRP